MVKLMWCMVVLMATSLSAQDNQALMGDVQTPVPDIALPDAGTQPQPMVVQPDSAPQPIVDQQPVVMDQPQPQPQPEQPAAMQPMPDQGQSVGDLAVPSSEPAAPIEQAQPEQALQPTAEQSQPMQPAPVQKPQENLNFGEGVDTIDVESGGNWLHKRVIWEDAQAKYEKIKNLLTRVLESRIDFFTQRSEIDRKLNHFFVDIGFAQGELEEIMQSLLDLIELDRQQQGSLNAQERDIREKLVEKKNEIEQLRMDAKSIADLDAALDEALEQLVKQINLVASYEKDSWKRFKDIGQELNDKKAKEYYLHMDTDQKNIENIASYINGALKQYVNNILSKIDEYMGSIKTRLDNIKSSGIELKQKLSQLEQATQQQKADELRQEQEALKRKPKPTSWYESVLSVLAYPFTMLARFGKWIMSFFGK